MTRNVVARRGKCRHPKPASIRGTAQWCPACGAIRLQWFTYRAKQATYFETFGRWQRPRAAGKAGK